MSYDISYLNETSLGISELKLKSRELSSGIIKLYGMITSEKSEQFLSQMIYLQQEGINAKILINSSGGEIDAGLMIYDCIQAFTNEIDIYCVGNAFSMAAIILAAGRTGHRHIFKHSKVMIHEVLLRGGIEGSATSISQLSDRIIETRDLVNGIIAKHTGKTLQEINILTSTDYFMAAEDAINFGICDDIKENLDI